MNKWFFITIAAGLIAFTLLLSGCVSVPDLSGTGSFEPGKVDGVGVNLISSEPDFSLTRGCIWTTTVQVFNTGQAEVRNVQVYLELIDAESGAVRDTRTVYVGALAPGESRSISAELDGDCINEYNLRAVPILL
jgi:hypothetical protein